jgi:hypothetical protein
VGAYEDALAAWARAKKMRDDAGIGFVSPVGDGYRAMALHELGRYEQANAAMQQARSAYGEKWISGTNATFFLECVIEAEKFFAGEDKTLLSIWELIEENKLDEASRLIEEARSSQNADSEDRMEGAIRLLDALRKK